jgi:hypothetical protein
LTGNAYEHARRAHPRDLYRTIIKNERGTPLSTGNEDLPRDDISVENWIRRRDANWKIILQTGPQGDNIPNLTFGNDADGNAENVVAVDVLGNLWIMDIFTTSIPHERIPGLHHTPTGSRRAHLGK